jgi:hypothetical protein
MQFSGPLTVLWVMTVKNPSRGVNGDCDVSIRFEALSAFLLLATTSFPAGIQCLQRQIKNKIYTIDEFACCHDGYVHII